MVKTHSLQLSELVYRGMLQNATAGSLVIRCGCFSSDPLKYLLYHCLYFDPEVTDSVRKARLNFSSIDGCNNIQNM